MIPSCHPDQPYGARGLCKPCYDHQRYLEQRDEIKERSRLRYEEFRNTEIASRRERRLRRAYGITGEDYERMYFDQRGVCAICLEVCPTGKLLAVDHDHVTGRVRGLLCTRCNQGLGRFQDRRDLLEAAARYLG